VVGKARARQVAVRLIDDAKAALENEDDNMLRQIAEYIGQRQS